MNKFKNVVITSLFAAVILVPSAASAQTTSMADMLALIESLMKQVTELQAKLGQAKSEIRDAIKAGLKEGMTDDDIAKIQELLATDPEIYPQGLRTGYFGPLTKEAIKRFQTKHELTVTGEIDEETRELMEEYLGEKFGGKIPPGLLKAPGIRAKIEKRFAEGCDDTKGMAFLCKKLKDKLDDDDEEEEEEDEDFDVKVEIEDEDTTVSFTFDGDDYEVTTEGTDLDDVLADVADELDVDTDDLDEDLADEIERKLEKALEDEEEDDFKVEVDIDVENASTTSVTITFEFDGDEYEVELDSSDTDDVRAAVADELDVDEDDLDEDLWDAIEAELEDELEEEEN